MVTSSTEAVLSVLSSPLQKVAVRELSANGLDASRFSARIADFEARVSTPEFQSELETNAVDLTSFLFCFSTMKKRSVAQKYESADVKTRDYQQIDVQTIAQWSDSWVEEGRIALSEVDAAEKAEKSTLYAPFGNNCLEEFITMCLFKQAIGDFAAQRKWAFFGIDTLANCIKDSQIASFKTSCQWLFINAVMLALPCPTQLTSLKQGSKASEEMAAQSKKLDELDAQFAVTSLLDIHDKMESAAAKKSVTVNGVVQKVSMFEDPAVITSRVRWITNSLWLLFRYYLPRHLTYAVSRQSIPRHSQWNELIDTIFSDNTISFIDVVKPSLMDFVYVICVALRRRVDISDPVSCHAANNLNSSHAKLFVALQANNFADVNTLLSNLPDQMKDDFFFSPIANELIEQFRLGVVEAYYKIHRSIDQNGVLSNIDVKLIASRMPNSEVSEPNISGDSQQLMIRASYMINNLEKEADRYKESLGL